MRNITKEYLKKIDDESYKPYDENRDKFGNPVIEATNAKTILEDFEVALLNGIDEERNKKEPNY